MAPAKASRRSAPVRRTRDDDGRFDGTPTPTGFGSLSHKPRIFPNPKTFAGRRAAARQRYQ